MNNCFSHGPLKCKIFEQKTIKTPILWLLVSLPMLKLSQPFFFTSLACLLEKQLWNFWFFSIFAPIKALVHQFRTSNRFTQRSAVYNFCPNENKLFHRISSVSKHCSFAKNRGSEIEKWKLRPKPSKTTVTSQISSAKTVFTSLMHRLTLFNFNLCRDIEKNPGPRAGRHFMN